MSVKAETKVTWYGNKVMAKIKGGSSQVIRAMAFQCEGLTKDRITANGQVVTGFMRNSVYTVTTEGVSGGVESTTLTDEQGHTVQRTSVPPPELGGEDVSICGVGANYAIYQEVKNPFLRPSFDTVVAGFETTVTGIFGEVLSD